MILCDVNVLLHAMIAESPHHARCRHELEQLRHRDEEMAYSQLVLAAVLRIATNPRVYRPTPAVREVFSFLDAVRQYRRAVRVEPGERHWDIFQDLVLTSGSRGPDTTDAFLAALAIEHGCEWWSTDKGFERFPGLRWRYLLSIPRAHHT